MAKESIVLIDDFVDEETIKILQNKSLNVPVTVFSKNRLMYQIRNVRRRKSFKSGFQFFLTSEFRNMYILIDNKFLYLLSRPIRYSGKRSFWYIQILDVHEISRVRTKVEECSSAHKNHCRHF